MIYRKLKRTWSRNDLNYIPRLREVFPELSRIDSEELADRFHELKLDFYYEEQKPVKWFVRLTLPFGLTLMLLMLIILPLKFIITGTWQYSLGKNNRILNWFKALKLQ